MSVAQATFCATLVDEWVRGGVTDAVVCPGSRSTPLSLALAARPELRLHVRLDERSAGFFAVGLAYATGRPPVVCVTSGTAAAELHPAVIEAHHARVPVIVATADRPPELHKVGAPQTIDQEGLYGTALRWSVSPGVATPETEGTWRSLGARALAEAEAGPLGPGPVHLNLAFREPLVEPPGALPPGRPDGRPHLRVAAGQGLSGTVTAWPSGRGLLVVGAGGGTPDLVLAAAEHLGWPVLADPRSGCRLRHPHVVAAADALARVEAVRRELAPAVVVRLGSGWASKALPGLLVGADLLAVDPWWRWEDPDRVASRVVRADPDAFLRAVLVAAPAPKEPGWLASWQRAEAAAQSAIDRAVGAAMSEPLLGRHLLRSLPEEALVVVSSSMPVRDLEWYAPALDAPARVVSNRGANGIDGVCSTALGAAAAARSPVVGVVGDLAFLHDLSGLVRPLHAAPADCTLVVVDNGGGGIFDFLPQASTLDRDRFETLFGTPQAADVAAVAAALGWRAADVGDVAGLDGALAASVGRPGLDVVRVRVPDRMANVAVHEQVHAAVAEAVADLALGPHADGAC